VITCRCVSVEDVSTKPMIGMKLQNLEVPGMAEIWIGRDGNGEFSWAG